MPTNHTKANVPEVATARDIVKHISDAAIELAFTRHDLTSDQFDETNYPDVGGSRQREQAFEQFIEEVKDDTLNCLTGDDSGCLDPEELDESNCELIWLTKQINAYDTLRAENAALRAALEAIAVWRKDSPCWCGELRNSSGLDHVSWCVEAAAALAGKQEEVRDGTS